MKGILSALLHSDICPTVFWDISAKKSDEINGIPVEKPDFAHLSASDTVLVCLKKQKWAEEVIGKLNDTPTKDNSWYYYDVLNYLVKYYLK
jgi:hypothetical protein